MMIPQPPVVTVALIDKAVAEAGRKKDLPGLTKLRFERLKEGLSAQVMHVVRIRTSVPPSSGCTPSSPNGASSFAGSITRST